MLRSHLPALYTATGRPTPPCLPCSVRASCYLSCQMTASYMRNFYPLILGFQQLTYSVLYCMHLKRIPKGIWYIEGSI